MASEEGLLGIRERYISVVESSYGTAPSFSNARVPGVNVIITPNFTQGFQEVLSSGADNRTVNKKVAGPLGMQYTAAYYPTNWHRLKYMFDIDSETGSDPYTHTLSVGNTIKSFSAEWAMRRSSDQQIFLTVGNVINQMTIAFAKASGEGNDGFITCTEAVIAQDYTTPGSLESGTFTDTDDPYQYRHSTITLNSSEVVEINNGEITFSQGINPNDSRYANSALDRTIGTPIPLLFRVTGRFNINMLSTTLTALWETATNLSGTNTIVFSQSAGKSLTLTLSGMTVNPVPIAGTNIEGVNTGDFVFTATGVAVVAIDDIQNW